MAYFFIADTHFGHENALAFDNRPFKTIEEHDRALTENWNNAVGPEDEVFVLGDISWHNATKTNEILRALNGKKHLIVGNHDKRLLKNREFQSLFLEIADYKELTFPQGKGIVLSHYPIPCFNHHYYGWCHQLRAEHDGAGEVRDGGPLRQALPDVQLRRHDRLHGLYAQDAGGDSGEAEEAGEGLLKIFQNL